MRVTMWNVLPKWKADATLAYVAGGTTSPQEARIAVAEAVRQEANLRRTDRHFRLVLLVVATVDVALGFLLGLPHVQQPAVNPGLSLLIFLGGGALLSIVLLVRMRAMSRWGMARFSWSVAAFSIWNAMVVAFSTGSGWYGAGQPGWHFTASSAVAAIPLFVGAAAIGWHRR